MHWAIFGVIVYALGLVSGIVLLRFGAGFGVKMVYRIREDMPLDEPRVTEEDTWQQNTAQDEIEENIVS